MAILSPEEVGEDTVDYVDGLELPDEMAECVYEAVALGRRMRNSSNGEEPFYLKDCPFQPGSELAFAWKKGFLQSTRASQPYRVKPGKVDWRRDGF